MSIDEVYESLWRMAEIYGLTNHPVFSELEDFSRQMDKFDRLNQLPPELLSKIRDHLPDSDRQQFSKIYPVSLIYDGPFYPSELEKLPPGAKVRNIILGLNEPTFPEKFKWPGLKIHDFERIEFRMKWLIETLCVFRRLNPDRENPIHLRDLENDDEFSNIVSKAKRFCEKWFSDPYQIQPELQKIKFLFNNEKLVVSSIADIWQHLPEFCRQNQFQVFHDKNYQMNIIYDTGFRWGR